jgi:RNA polymerase sigma-70 factor (ECF subfamily)
MNAQDLERLYDEHAAAAYAFALRLSRDPSVAEDLLQTVFCSLAGKARLWLFNPRSFILKCIYRCWVDAVRRQKTMERTLETLESDLFQASKNAPLPGDVLNGENQNLAHLLEGVRALPEEQRAVLHLKVWEDQTFAQIGANLRISPNTAASRYRYALQKLRTQIREEVQP